MTTQTFSQLSQEQLASMLVDPMVLGFSYIADGVETMYAIKGDGSTFRSKQVEAGHGFFDVGGWVPVDAVPADAELLGSLYNTMNV